MADTIVSSITTENNTVNIAVFFTVVCPTKYRTCILNVFTTF